MRIGMFVELYRPVINGVQVSVDTLSTELQKLGHQVFIFAPFVPGYREENESVVRVASLPMKIKGYWVAWPWDDFDLKKLIKDLRIEIIHFHNPSPIGYLALRTAQANRLPIVFTYHTHIQEYLKYYTKLYLILWPVVKYWIRYLANQVDQIITPSNFVAHLLKSYGVKNLIKIIPTGVTLPQDLIPFSLSSRRLSLKGQANFIYVGRLAKEKNLDLLLKAFQFVRNNGLSSARLIMVGDGPERAKIEKKIIDMKLRGSVDLVGWQPHERVFSYFAQADIFVFPSKTESQGIVLLEAMLCGKPCIAVEAGGVPEIIDNSCGVLVGNNYQEMAIAMINLANSVDQYEFLSQQAIKHAQYFTPALQATRIEKIYQLFSD